MIKLRRKKIEESREWEPPQQDIIRIVRALKRGDYEISEADAAWAWRCYSGDFCAGWLGLPEKDENILERVLMYLEEAA